MTAPFPTTQLSFFIPSLTALCVAIEYNLNQHIVIYTNLVCWHRFCSL